MDEIGVLFGGVWCQYSLLSSSGSVCRVYSVKEATSCSYNSQYALSIIENFLFLKFQSYRTAMNIIREVVNLILNNGWSLLPNIFSSEVDQFAKWALQNGPISLDEIETRHLQTEAVRLCARLWWENYSLLAPGKYPWSQHKARPGGGDFSPQVSKAQVGSVIAPFSPCLCRAVRKNHLYAVETMIAAGAEVDIPNIQGENNPYARVT